MHGKYIRKEGEKEMKNAIPLPPFGKSKEDIDIFVNRLQMLIRNNDGVLTGSTIWHEILYFFRIDLEKDIRDAFGIGDLKTKIRGLKSVFLNIDFERGGYYLSFDVDEGTKEDIYTDDLSEALATVNKELNKIHAKTGVKIEIGFNRIRPGEINVETVKDNIHYCINLYKGELDEVDDITLPIKRAIDISLRQVTK
jgi:hypothetical protein